MYCTVQNQPTRNTPTNLDASLRGNVIGSRITTRTDQNCRLLLIKCICHCIRIEYGSVAAAAAAAASMNDWRLSISTADWVIWLVAGGLWCVAYSM